MKLGVLGTGNVGRTLATKLVELGHDVKMGSRSAGNEAPVAWASGAGERGGEGTFAAAASFGGVALNATAGSASLDALRAAGAENLAGKILIDVANPLDFSAGMPPTLTVCNDDSLGESIQRAFPDARVVKTLNTVNSDVMVEPSIVPGRHTMFVSGNDDGAKKQVRAMLEQFGWAADAIVDLADISAARGQ
jgi:8-hydroxy-5-deazaflavin:NADPH oxidoreductase